MPLFAIRPKKLLFILSLLGSIFSASNVLASECHKEGLWLIPSAKNFTTTAELISKTIGQQVILLGEQHDIAEHHRWQLQTIASLFAQHSNMVLGFEMFPRRVQDVLNLWVAGQLSENEFLEQSEWKKVWCYDAALYMPLFHFARINKIPMLALNINRSAVRTASKKGLAKMSAEEREGVSLPAPASKDYLTLLANTFGGHGHDDSSIDETLKNDRFLRFVDAQQLWDRAMAEQLASAAKPTSENKAPQPLVVGVMGTGHIVERFGVPHQLADLGISHTQVLLPSNDDISCSEITERTADAIFSLSDYEEPEPAQKPLLGVHLMNEKGVVKITQIVEKSVAEQSGLKQGDTFVSLAGKTISSVNDVIATVQNMLTGTWLPIVIQRDGKSLELVAKFPSETSKKLH